MQIIDAHHHLWNLDDHKYPHLVGPESVRIWGPNSKLRKNYLICDFLEDIKNQNVVKSVHVQANYDPKNPADETRWLQAIADEPSSKGFPHGIVGWVDFMSGDCERILNDHLSCKNFRGIRQIASRHKSEPLLNLANINYLENEIWLNNFNLLKKYNLSFDHQICAHQAADTVQLAKRYPDVPIILVHLAFPIERHYAGIQAWKEYLQLMAECPNIFVKLSGVGMTDFFWSTSSIRNFILSGIDIFGVERCMFGSNFPVDKVMSNYDTLYQSFKEIVRDFSIGEKEKLFFSNADSIYRL